MTLVQVHKAAEDDLDKLWDTDPDAAAAIAVLLDEMEAGPHMAKTLTVRGYRCFDNPEYEVKRFEELWNKGLTVYLLKFWDADGGLIPHRIIYAHHPQRDVVHVLAVVHRSFNYDTSHPIVLRIKSDYEQLGIPSY